MFRHILIPIDGSAHAKRALERGVLLAKEVGARVTVLTVIEPFHLLSMDSRRVSPSWTALERQAEAAAVRLLAEGDKVAQKHGVGYATQCRRHGQPYKAILEAATKGRCDLIAMGSHGRRGVAALVLGSVATKVLTHGKVPVLIFR
ncbi:MAG: universal stress protein [Enhydrobacter sp.]|nr:MAG: universal stress protein [Enhydrobacter sp.]